MGKGSKRRPAQVPEEELASAWERTFGRTHSPSEPCRIHEYDGAFKCHTHDRLWGAVTDPDEPCMDLELEPEEPVAAWKGTCPGCESPMLAFGAGDRCPECWGDMEDAVPLYTSPTPTKDEEKQR